MCLPGHDMTRPRMSCSKGACRVLTRLSVFVVKRMEQWPSRLAKALEGLRKREGSIQQILWILNKTYPAFVHSKQCCTSWRVRCLKYSQARFVVTRTHMLNIDTRLTSLDHKIFCRLMTFRPFYNQCLTMSCRFSLVSFSLLSHLVVRMSRSCGCVSPWNERNGSRSRICEFGPAFDIAAKCGRMLLILLHLCIISWFEGPLADAWLPTKRLKDYKRLKHTRLHRLATVTLTPSRKIARLRFRWIVVLWCWARPSVGPKREQIGAIMNNRSK